MLIIQNMFSSVCLFYFLFKISYTNEYIINKLNDNLINLKKCQNWTVNKISGYFNQKIKNYEQIYSYLPDVSIVIVAYNEHYLHVQITLESILKNTVGNYLKEIILIDDYSENLNYKNFELLNKIIRVIRNPTRVGLIKSRIIGAQNAYGKILVFLDAHIKTTTNWLEPLVVRLVEYRLFNSVNNGADHIDNNENIDFDKQLIVSPLIYPIAYEDDEDEEDNNLEQILHFGGFSWNLIFRWHTPVEFKLKLLKTNKTTQNEIITNFYKQIENINPIEPYISPAISGGIFAVWKNSFFNYGAYDEQMDIWGGENIELSLRTWMCYGRIEIIPCSHVGHLFRNKHPYSFPMGKDFTVVRNLKRTALVWLIHNTSTMESKNYLAYFYSTLPGSSIIPAGDLSQRKLIAQNLKCKSFTWYLDNIYPLLKLEIQSMDVSNETIFLADLELNLSNYESMIIR